MQDRYAKLLAAAPCLKEAVENKSEVDVLIRGVKLGRYDIGVGLVGRITSPGPLEHASVVIDAGDITVDLSSWSYSCVASTNELKTFVDTTQRGVIVSYDPAGVMSPRVSLRLKQSADMQPLYQALEAGQKVTRFHAMHKAELKLGATVYGRYYEGVAVLPSGERYLAELNLNELEKSNVALPFDYDQAIATSNSWCIEDQWTKGVVSGLRIKEKSYRKNKRYPFNLILTLEFDSATNSPNTTDTVNSRTI